jgi:hypothetical protein
MSSLLGDDPFRFALQKVLDEMEGNWQVAYYAAAVCLQRLNEDGEVESTPYAMGPLGQADFITKALLLEGVAWMEGETVDHECDP